MRILILSQQIEREKGELAVSVQERLRLEMEIVRLRGELGELESKNVGVSATNRQLMMKIA